MQTKLETAGVAVTVRISLILLSALSLLVASCAGETVTAPPTVQPEPPTQPMQPENTGDSGSTKSFSGGALTCSGAISECGNQLGDLAFGFSLPYIEMGNDQAQSLTFTPSELDSPTLLVFYRSIFCGFCRRQLDVISAAYADFEERGINVIAISSDDFQGESQRLVSRTTEYQFPLAYTSLDPTVGEAYDRFGNVLDGDYLGGNELIDPGLFLINSEGRIVWHFIGERISSGLSAEMILGNADLNL